MGKGNIVFLFSKSPERSIEMMTQNKTCIPNGKYYYYFYKPMYQGYIVLAETVKKTPSGTVTEPGTKLKYRVNDMKMRDELIKKVSTDNKCRRTMLHPYPKKLEIMPTEGRNTYYDLSRYLYVLSTYTAGSGAKRYTCAFWNMFKPIFMDKYGTLTKKTVLIDAGQFPYAQGGGLKERLTNPLYMIYYTLYKDFKRIDTLDIDFLIYCDGKVLKINPSKCDDKSYKLFLMQLKLLYGGYEFDEVTDDEAEEANLDADDEMELEPEDVSTDPVSDDPDEITNMMSQMRQSIEKASAPVSKSNMVAASSASFDPAKGKDIRGVNKVLASPVMEKISPVSEAKLQTIENEAKKEAAKEEQTETPSKDRVDEKVAEKVNNDEELLKDIYAHMIAEKAPSSERSTARDQMLREKQKELVVKGMTIGDIAQIDPKATEIESNDISDAIETINPNMKEVKFQNFNKTYVDKAMTKDIVDVFEKLNDASIGMYILKIDVEDTSDVLNYKETWTVHLEDENRQRHTIKVDIPKFYDKNFLWLGGNKKVIKNQDFFLPVVKIMENRVMIVTNYNKMTLERVDANSLRAIVLVEKRLKDSPELQKYFIVGTATLENRPYITGLEYDEYAKKFIGFKNGGFVLWFSQKEAMNQAAKRQITIPKEKMLIGMNKTTPIFLDINTQRTEDGFDISDLILEHLPEEEVAAIRKQNVPKRLMYTKVTSMKQDVPVVILMCLWEGLSTVLKKANIKFRLVDSIAKERVSLRSENWIRFKNCYLVYDATVPNELLLNGLNVLDTASIEIGQMDTKDAYIPYIGKKYGKLSILNALNNVYEFTIGKIEEEILTDMGLPTDLVSVMVYANNLLADSQYVNELNQTQCRVRCAEIIPGILYDCIAKAYVPYKNSNGKKKLSVPQDIVIKKLLEIRTVEDYSSLNPFLELETTHGVSTKGFKGVNLEDSYTVPKRSYDPTMTGVIAVSSSPDAQVGVNRSLTMEPNIKSVRGYIDVKDDKLNEIKDVNLFSPAEMLIPLGATRDDPIRTGHSVKQSRASIPVKGSSPVLISNGSDDLCKYYLSSDFVVMADMDGKVIEYDENTKIMVVEYKDGSHRAINLDKNIVKNGGGGFELSNVLITNLKVGDKFKKNDTLAWHKDFFKYFPGQGVRMCVGAMVKVALFSSYNTYEDANFITEKVADMCQTEMCFRISVAIGKNSNIYRMVNVGDEVEVGDSLIDFDESFEESDINKLLANLGDNEELKEAVRENTKNSKKSKYSGKIEEIKIYAACELEDMSPSLRKVVSTYYKKIEAKKAQLEKYDNSNSIVKCGLMMTESSGKTEPDRYGNIRGTRVDDGVLIEFYVKHGELLEVGSKVANFSPLKDIVSEIVPGGYEPFSEFRPDEEVSTTISPSSILNRMVSSILPTIFGNKCIVELKRSLEVIWRSGKEFTEIRKKMESLIYRFFTAFDKSGDNTKRYKAFFQPMTDQKFKVFFKGFFADPNHYLILEIVDYERTIMVEDTERAAKVLGIPLFEYVTFPHYTMDKDHPIVTKHPIPVGYIHLKRPQQTVMKKNGASTSSEQRSAFTGQVTGADKNGRESDIENCMLTSLGMTHTLKELNGPRADDLVMKKEMLQEIQTKGYLQLGDLTDRLENKTTLNTINTYFLGMHLKTDLVSKGLRLPYTNEKE